MRRTYPILSAITLSAALVACYAAWGQSPPRTSSPPPGPPPSLCSAPSQPAAPHRPACAARSDNEKLVEGLVAILNETDSTDTLLVTVAALADLGPRARLAVPAIIRAADRLGLFKGLAQQKKGQGEDHEGMAVVDAIDQILKGGARPPACCYAPVPAACSPTPSGWSVPAQVVGPTPVPSESRKTSGR